MDRSFPFGFRDTGGSSPVRQIARRVLRSRGERRLNCGG